jgi:hypothetical protein
MTRNELDYDDLIAELEQKKRWLVYRAALREAVNTMGGDPDPLQGYFGAITEIRVGGRTILKDGCHKASLPHKLQARMDKLDRRAINGLRATLEKKIAVIDKLLDTRA